MMMEKQALQSGRIDLTPLIARRREDSREVELVRSIVAQINEYIERVIPGLSAVAANLRARKLADANRDFNYIIDGIDWIAQLIAIFKERYGREFTELKSGNISTDELEKDLLDILTNVVAGHIRNDWTVTSALLEQELTRNLASWKIIFPQTLGLEEKGSL
jgi:hypothetical protein